MYRLVYNEKTRELIMAIGAEGVDTSTKHIVEEFETEGAMRDRIKDLDLVDKDRGN